MSLIMRTIPNLAGPNVLWEAKDSGIYVFALVSWN
jgi:hypothetical protein